MTAKLKNASAKKQSTPTKKRSVKTQSPRIAAINIISQLLKQQNSLSGLLTVYAATLSDQDGRLLKELCFGCCRWHPQLDHVLSRLLKQPLKAKDADIEAALLLGLYQLQFMRTADYAVINESVNAAVILKKHWAKKLINAILRGFQRRQEEIWQQAQQALPTAHPQWLVTEIEQAWPQQAGSIFIANNQHPPFTLRVNQQQHGRDDYLKQLEEKNILAEPTPFSEVGIVLEQAQPVTVLPGFSEGVVSVQDEAAQLAVTLLDLQPDQRVLDACCAPGGKTCHIGESQPALAELVAIDVESRRLQKVHDNLKRTGVNAEVICGDATQVTSWWDGRPFDRILLDAPCSATGILRRQPDIKLLRQPEQLTTLVALQLKLLQSLWPLLAEGGILVYATCSILPQENTQLVEQFLEAATDAKHDPIVASWGVKQPFGRQLLPGASAETVTVSEATVHDGFFYARLKKSV